jgi:hypothetical protein
VFCGSAGLGPVIFKANPATSSPDNCSSRSERKRSPFLQLHCDLKLSMDRVLESGLDPGSDLAWVMSEELQCIVSAGEPVSGFLVTTRSVVSNPVCNLSPNNQQRERKQTYTGSHTQAPRLAWPAEEVECQMFWVSCSMLPQLAGSVAVVCLSRAHVKDKSWADGKPLLLAPLTPHL